MKRICSLFLALAATAALAVPALAAEMPQVCYPTSVTRTEDGGEIRKVYDLAPDEDPAGIPRSDFEQDGFAYTLTDLLRQESPEYEERTHTETVTVESKSKDMATFLGLLPQQREFVTEDGLTGILTLQLDTVQIEIAGYGSSTKTLTATRSYPGLATQDTSFIPKTVEDSGHALTLQSIDWRTEGEDRFTAVATYAGSATSSYVKGYTVTADYVGTVSRIALNKVRYVAIFEGTPLKPAVPELIIEPETPEIPFNWAWVFVPLGVIALAGGGVGLALFLKKRSENEEDAE